LLSPLASFTLQTNRIAPRGLERGDRKQKPGEAGLLFRSAINRRAFACF
jgi:hypothetical protein